MAVTADLGELAVDFFDAEEGVEDLAVHEALWVLGGLVAHEAVDERVRGRLDENTGEGSVKEVRLDYRSVM